LKIARRAALPGGKGYFIVTRQNFASKPVVAPDSRIAGN
jgi:hypothetical protein